MNGVLPLPISKTMESPYCCLFCFTNYRKSVKRQAVLELRNFIDEGLPIVLEELTASIDLE